MGVSRASAISLLSLGISGCLGYHASSGPYSPGYSEVRDGSGRYLVQYNGPGVVSPDALRKHLERRASELCSGPCGVSDYIVDTQLVMHGDPVEYNFAKATVTCTNP